MKLETTAVELTYLFAPNEEHRPVVLLGAGASFTSGIPLAGAMVTEIARWAYARKIRNTTPEHIQLRRSEWETFLKSQPWFTDAVPLADLYQNAVKELLVPREFRRSFFQNILSLHKKPSVGYHALAQLCKRHLVSHFLTTNFDTLIEQSLGSEAPHIREVTTVNKTPLDLEAFSPNRKAQIVYLHGSVENYSDKNLPSEVLNLDEKLLGRIHSLIEYSPIVVVGYRGAEASIMQALFEKGLEISGNYRRGIYWCIRGSEAPHPNVLKLQEKIGSNFRFVQISGFDELFSEINRTLSSESLNPRLALPNNGTSTASSKDSQPFDGTSLEDLDQPTLKGIIQEHHRRINNSEICDFEAHLLEYEFASKQNGKIVPHFGLWLLFGLDVTKRMPFLKSVLRIGDKEQRVIEGNLISQFNEIRQVLELPEINPILRIKKLGGADEKRAFHPRALLELLVNHFAHRDYSIEEPCEIHIQPGKGITFTTVGGLPTKVLAQLNPDETGRFQPRRGVREQRNALLADVFYGMRVMDREGSGLVDVQRFAIEHEGDVDFRVNSCNSAVTVTLLQAEADPDGRGRTAHALNDKIVFMANLFRFHQLPAKIFKVPLLEFHAKNVRELSKSGLNFEKIPPLRTHSGSFICFESMGIYQEELSKVACPELEREEPIDEWLSDGDKRKIIVALLRKHWEKFLLTFATDGLRIDGKRRRAFFTPDENGTRSIVYDSLARKGTSREVVKHRETFKECEGISYSVEQFGNIWAIQTKPIYVFTDLNGRPLLGLSQTKKATKRYKFDRNIQVVQDLNFWACYLGKKKPVIDLGFSTNLNVFIDGNFLEMEATETIQ